MPLDRFLKLQIINFLKLSKNAHVIEKTNVGKLDYIYMDSLSSKPMAEVEWITQFRKCLNFFGSAHFKKKKKKINPCQC